MLLSTQRLSDVDFDFLRLYYQRKVDGLIFLGDTKLSEEDIKKIDKEKIPSVVIGDRPLSNSISFVDSDNIDGGYNCTKRLIDKGHKRIAFLSVSSKNLNVQERLRGYKKALSESNIQFSEDLIGYGDYTEKSGYDFMKSILEKDIPPTALICGTDNMAFGAFSYTIDHSINVPEEISLVGFDAMDLIRFTNPPLSSNKQPLIQMGRKGAEMLFHRIDKPDMKKETHFFKIAEFPGKSIADLSQAAQ